MKRFYGWLVVSATFAVSCDNTTPIVSDDRPNQKLSRNSIIAAAQNIMADREHYETIWNMSSIDTANPIIKTDNFIDAHKKTTIALFEGEAGLSAGSAHYLLVVFDDSMHAVYAGQSSSIDTSEIADLDNDSVKEIILHYGSVWMGECNENYEIVNFKAGKRNQLYSAFSTSVIDCGLENLRERYTKGDTLAVQYSCRIVHNNGVNFVEEIKTVKISNGGEADKEIIKLMDTTVDTTLVAIKDGL